jgi:regulatory protein SWI5
MVVDDERPFLCIYNNCGKRFKRKEHLANHISIHFGLKNFRCTVNNCEWSFITQAQLKRHIKTHENPHLWICVTCSSSFSKKSKLREHRLIEHNISEFTCMIGKKQYFIL